MPINCIQEALFIHARDENAKVNYLSWLLRIYQNENRETNFKVFLIFTTAAPQ